MKPRESQNIQQDCEIISRIVDDSVTGQGETGGVNAVWSLLSHILSLQKRIDELETKLKQKRNRVGIDYSEYHKLEAENKGLCKALEYYKNKSDSRVARQALEKYGEAE